MLVSDGLVHAVVACDPEKAHLSRLAFVHMKVNK